MSEYKELYLPFFFSWDYMTEELTDTELGQILRALLANYTERKVPDNLTDKMRIIYKFMLDGAVRAHASQRELSEKRRESANKRWAKSASASSDEECKSMQNDASGCKAIEEDAINGNGNINGNKNGNINGNGYYNRFAQKNEREKVRHGNFDPEEAFQRAVERSYGKKLKD